MAQCRWKIRVSNSRRCMLVLHTCQDSEKSTLVLSGYFSFLAIPIQNFFLFREFFPTESSEVTYFLSPLWQPEGIDSQTRWGGSDAPTWDFKPWRSNLEVQRSLDTLIETEQRVNQGHAKSQWSQRHSLTRPFCNMALVMHLAFQHPWFLPFLDLVLYLSHLFYELITLVPSNTFFFLLLLTRANFCYFQSTTLPRTTSQINNPKHLGVSTQPFSENL